MSSTPEAKVKVKIKRWLNERGAYHVSPIGSAFGTHGVPDLLVCLGGTFVAIEVKAPGKIGNLTENQKLQLEQIQKSGGVAFVADDLQTVIDKLTPLL